MMVYFSRPISSDKQVLPDKIPKIMELSNRNAVVLLLDTNQDIEEYVKFAVKNIIENRKFDSLTYPPSGRLTKSEKAELNKPGNNENLKNALRKVIAVTLAVMPCRLCLKVKTDTDKQTCKGFKITSGEAKFRVHNKMKDVTLNPPGIKISVKNTEL